MVWIRGVPIGSFRRRPSFEIRLSLLVPDATFGERDISKVNGDGVFQHDVLDNR